MNYYNSTVCIVKTNVKGMESIKETITELFVATDQRAWDKVEAIFSDTVLLDYSSMSGQPACCQSYSRTNHNCLERNFTGFYYYTSSDWKLLIV